MRPRPHRPHLCPPSTSRSGTTSATAIPAVRLRTRARAQARRRTGAACSTETPGRTMRGMCPHRAGRATTARQRTQSSASAMPTTRSASDTAAATATIDAAYAGRARRPEITFLANPVRELGQGGPCNEHRPARSPRTPRCRRTTPRQSMCHCSRATGAMKPRRLLATLAPLARGIATYRTAYTSPYHVCVSRNQR